MHISQNVKLLPKVSTSPHLHILPAKPNPNLSSCQFKGIMHLYVALGHISNEGGGCLIKCIMLVQFFFFSLWSQNTNIEGQFLFHWAVGAQVCVCVGRWGFTKSNPWNEQPSSHICKHQLSISSLECHAVHFCCVPFLWFLHFHQT